ncbi:MAG: SDR family oxidoreductase [Lachnospiraceae bacterium]|jgi:NAD(P)-dependent dehydrogenase (short-subunit alcohol dehydrogenase family)|nr:SDR family oxidoreductase [Lachnospiraceae bacterium]
MPGRLSGKTAVVTGAGNGMGEACTRLFAQEGAHVIAVDVSAKDMEKWQGAGQVTPLVADLTGTEGIEAVARAVEDAGKLDALCNIAGMNDLSYPLEATDDARWDRIMDLDLKAPFRLCRRLIPLMVQGGGGAVVNIGSYAALRGNHGPSYTAAKAGLAGLTRSIAFAYGSQGIRCNIIHPGGMRTNIGEHSGGAYHPEGQARLTAMVKAMPFFCYGDPVEIANACLFLCSDEAKLINGASLSVDAGMSVC